MSCHKTKDFFMKTRSLFMVGALALGLVACGDDAESPVSDVTVVAKATLDPTSSGGRLAAGSTGVTLDEFKINIREIEFEYDKEDDESEVKDVYDDVKLYGPFEIDLLNAQGDALSKALTSTSIPNGDFEEIEFKLHKGKVEGNAMYNKSVQASGTINGTPFVFWHDTDEEFEIDFEDVNKDITLRGQSLEVIINFNLGLLFNSASGVDLSQARDGNGDGVITIDPKNTDGNKWLADLLKDALEDATDLIDDK